MEPLINDPMYIRGSRGPIGFDNGAQFGLDYTIYDRNAIKINPISEYILKNCPYRGDLETLIQNGNDELIICEILRLGYTGKYIAEEQIELIPETVRQCFKASSGYSWDLWHNIRILLTVRYDGYQKTGYVATPAILHPYVMLCWVEYMVQWDISKYVIYRYGRPFVFYFSPELLAEVIGKIFPEYSRELKTYNLNPHKENWTLNIPDFVGNLLDGETVLSGGAVLKLMGLEEGTIDDFDLYTIHPFEEVDHYFIKLGYRHKYDPKMFEQYSGYVMKYEHPTLPQCDMIFIRYAKGQKCLHPWDFIWQEFDFSHVKNWVQKNEDGTYAINIMHLDDLLNRKFRIDRNVAGIINKHKSKTTVQRKFKYISRGWTFYGEEPNYRSTIGIGRTINPIVYTVNLPLYVIAEFMTTNGFTTRISSRSECPLELFQHMRTNTIVNPITGEEYFNIRLT